MNGEAHYWRNPDGTIEVRPLEESGVHYGRSTAGGVRMVLWKLGRPERFSCWGSLDGIMEAQTVGEVQKDAAQGRKPEEPKEGRPLTNFGWGYFIPNTSLPTFEFKFRMKEVQRNFYSRSCSLDFRAQLPSDILAFDVRVCWSLFGSR